MSMRSSCISYLSIAFLLLLPFSREAIGQTVNCNLAPNAAFEQGTASTIDQWNLAQNSGSATFAVSVYPSPVQSGARAAKVVVAQSGDLYLYTPEPGNIPVYPSTAYKLSARMKSDLGKIAGIRIIEWNGSTPQADRLMALNTGSGTWETLESGFTTTAQTTTVSIRLSHHVPGAAGTGTFYWDDVALWQDCADRCADVRHYIGQTTPGNRLCSDAQGTFCVDGIKTPGGEYLSGDSLGALGYFSHTLASRSTIGVQKSFGGAWVCFSNPDEVCGAARTSPGQNAQFPPQPLAISLRLPVLPPFGLAGPPPGPTPGAALIHNWQLFGERHFDPVTGTSGALIGDILHRTWAFLLQSYNFGGNIGMQSNVLVVEGESLGASFCHDGFGGGSRFERYMYIRGLGLAYEEGWDNLACRMTPNAVNCNGVYADDHQAVTLTNQLAGDLAITNGAPGSFNVVDWW
jgi:hypothetical protein